MPKHHAKAAGISLFKAISTIQLTPAILKELRMALSRRKKKPVVPAGIRSTTSAVGVRFPYVYRVCSRASAKLTNY